MPETLTEDAVDSSEPEIGLGRFFLREFVTFIRQKIAEASFTDSGENEWDSLVNDMNTSRALQRVGPETMALLGKYRLRVSEVLQRAQKEKAEQPLDLKFEVPVHVHFWLQVLWEKDPSKLVLEYDPSLNLASEPVHEAQPQHTKMASQLLHLLVRNLSELEQQFGEKLDEISELLKTKSLLIVTNHDTWLTQLLTIYLTQKLLPNFQLSQNKVLVGPALTTFSQLGGLKPDAFARAFAEVILTLPDTERGRPPEIDPKNIASFLRKTLQHLSETSKTSGNVLHLAPSGTTDLKRDGHLQLVPPAQSTRALLETLHSRMAILPIGFNAGKIYQNGKGIPHRGDVQMRIGTMIKSDSLPKGAVGLALMDRIANLVVNQNDQIIGKFDPDFVKGKSH